ncbi:MAG: adenylyl-sulfate kinase [Flavobacterium psychrophilum]|nr:MAG: adenylyl-sulfate kinase [Flavobacterium psychrophilum]
MENNLFPLQAKIQQHHRVLRFVQNPKIIWFTGLSGSGKSTLANQLELCLYQRHFKTYLLDGDNIRSGLNNDLDFSDESRMENIRRIGEVGKLFLDAGLIVLAAFISPFENDRQKVRQIVGADNLIEIFVDCPLSVCEQRDVKGLYQKAHARQILNFTGITSPYENPGCPDLTIQTHLHSVSDSVEILLNYVLPRIQSNLHNK